MDDFDWLPGDIAACYGTDWTSKFITYGTASLFAPRRLRLGPSHVAVMCQYHGTNIWVESTTLCPTPCLIQGRQLSGTQAHRPADRIRNYLDQGGHVDVYRLTAMNRLTPDESRLMSEILVEQFLKNSVQYDLSGALLSGTRFLQLTRIFPETRLNELFCSELVSAVTMRLNRMNHAIPGRYHPGRLLRTLVRLGKYEWHTRFDNESHR